MPVRNLINLFYLKVKTDSGTSLAKEAEEISEIK